MNTKPTIRIPAFDERDLRDKIVEHPAYIPTLRDAAEIALIEETANKYLVGRVFKVTYDKSLVDQILTLINSIDKDLVSSDIEEPTGYFSEGDDEDNTDEDDWKDDYRVYNRARTRVVFASHFEKMSVMAAIVITALHDVKFNFLNDKIPSNMREVLMTRIEDIKEPRSLEEKYEAYREEIMGRVSELPDNLKIEIVATILNSIPDIDDPGNKLVKELEKKVAKEGNES
jgi:hypothetical protein